MRELTPFLALYKKHWLGLSFGILLALITLIASVGLLTLSGWFIAASSVAALLSISQFNYMLPAAGVRGLSIIRTTGRWSERVVSHNVTFKLLADLRLFFFKKLTPLIPNRQLNLRNADLLNRLIADVDAMDHVYLRLITPFIVGLLSTLGISLFLFWFSPVLGITLGTILLCLMTLIPICFYRLGKPHGEKLTLATSCLRIALLDWLNGHAELTLYQAEKRYRASIDEAQAQLLSAQRKMAHITGLSLALLMIASGFSLILMLWLSAQYLQTDTANPFIAMVAFATMASFELLAPVAGAFQYLSQTNTSAARLNEILAKKPETCFSNSTINQKAKGHIRFNEVSFAYSNKGPKALNAVSVEIKTGEKIAILGQTGSGKSTLLQLLTRNWDPCSGQISLDEIALDKWQESCLRQSISLVSQRVDIFSGSLRSNLLLAKPSASDEELMKALQKVKLHALLDNQGLDTWLGEGGRQLSGGEKRRLSIVRVLLRDAAVLLLDEPTEGLDIKTEQEILQVLFAFAKNKTVIFVTHRLVALPQMDNILLMDNGQIIEQGSHAALITQQGRYAQLMQRI